MDPVHLEHSSPSEVRLERFTKAYDSYADAVYMYCLRRTPCVEDAQDVLADTFKVAWQKSDDIPDGEAARPWLFAVARNHLRNRWRRSQKAAEVTERLVSEFAVTSGPLDPADKAVENGEHTLRALGRLKQADQEVIKLVCWENLTHSEVAEVLGCSENAVAIRVHRAKARLSEVMARD